MISSCCTSFSRQLFVSARRRIGITCDVVIGRNGLKIKSFSSKKAPIAPTRIKSLCKFAVVEHGEAYFDNMEGRHGKQLSLAYNGEANNKKDKYLPDNLLDLFNGTNDDKSDVLSSSSGGGSSTRASRTRTNVSNNNEEDIPDAEIVTDGDDDEEEYEDDDDVGVKYNNDGSVIYEDPSELEAYKAGAPAGGMFAVILLGNASQHKVTLDDVIIVNKLLPVSKWKVGSTITLDSEQEVLLIGSQERTIVGLSPGIPNAVVQVMVEEITHDATVVVFKKKRRKNYRRKNGFRRQVTMLRVLTIQMPPHVETTSTKSSSGEDQPQQHQNAD